MDESVEDREGVEAHPVTETTDPLGGIDELVPWDFWQLLLAAWYEVWLVV